MTGHIRVGRLLYNKRKKVYPKYNGYTLIEVMTPSTKYGSLSPYSLKDEKGRIIENIWQFSKIFEYVPKVRETYSRWNKTIIWEYPEEVHIYQGYILPQYWMWREKGMTSNYPIRYPAGFNYRKNAICSIPEYNKNLRLSYIEARKAIYLPIYYNSVVKEKQFTELKDRLNKGENLLIAEVDGPHEEATKYYMNKYDTDSNFIVNNSINATEKNIHLMLNDSTYSFGHGYCLAAALLGISIEKLTT